MSSLQIFMIGFGIGALFVMIAMAIITDPTVPITHLYMDDKKYECAIVWESHVVCNTPPTKAAVLEKSP